MHASILYCHEAHPPAHGAAATLRLDRIRLGSRSVIGPKACVLPGATLGALSVCGPNSVVAHCCLPEASFWAGAPLQRVADDPCTGILYRPQGTECPRFLPGNPPEQGAIGSVPVLLLLVMYTLGPLVLLPMVLLVGYAPGPSPPAASPTTVRLSVLALCGYWYISLALVPLALIVLKWMVVGKLHDGQELCSSLRLHLMDYYVKGAEP